MSLEKCGLCGIESTPWYHTTDHICIDCYKTCRAGTTQYQEGYQDALKDIVELQKGMKNNE